MGQLKTKTKQMPGEEAAIQPDEYETKDDYEPADEVGVTEEVEDEPEEKFSAQILRRIHEHHSLLMQEYDELAQMNEHEEIGEFVTKLLGGIEETLTAVEELFEKHHGDLPPLEGAMGKDLDENEEEATEADSEKEDLPTPEEVVEGMETKGLQGKRAKAMTKEESEDVVDKIREETDDKEEKHLCDRCAKDMEDAGTGLGDEENQPVPGADDAESVAEDTNLGDEEEVKSWHLSTKGMALDAAKYLKDVSGTDDFNDESRHEAYYHSRNLDKACKDFPQNPEVGETELETTGDAQLPDDLKALPNQGEKIAPLAAAAIPAIAGAVMGDKGINHPGYKAASGASGFMRGLSDTRDFGDPHREKALTWHKALNDAFGEMENQDDAAEVAEGDNPVPLGEVQEKAKTPEHLRETAPPHLREIWQNGITAGYGAGKESDNPHKPGSKEAHAWETGFWGRPLYEVNKAFPEMDEKEDDAEINGAEKSVPTKANGKLDPTKALEQSFAKAIAERESNAKQMKKLQQQLAAVASRLN